MTPPLLILTVGTGTAGRESNVAEGMANTIRMIGPRAYWLVPSASEKSVPVADLIRESVGAGSEFVAWAEGDPYRKIVNPDALEDCRATIREVIGRARASLEGGQSLLLNPTSGTKQMSAGAVLAALDEGIGEVVFTVGDRADGVVRTGTERIERFDAAGFYADRDYSLARELAAAGSLSAAHAILARHPSLAEHATMALCLHEWERQNYEPARQLASKVADPAWAPARRQLTELAACPDLDPLIIADLLVSATLFATRNNHERSLLATCKALEMGLRHRLAATTGLRPPYSLDGLRTLRLSHGLFARLEGNSRDGKSFVLGLSQVVEILSSLCDPMAGAYRADRRLPELVGIRNELAHSIRAVSPDESADFLARTRALFAGMLPRQPDRPQLPALR